VDGALRPFAKDRAQAEQYAGMFKEENFKEAAPPFLNSTLTPNTPAAVRDQIKDLVANATPHVAVSSWRGMLLDEKLWQDDQIKVPAQVINAKSRLWTPDYKQFVEKLAPGVDYREFEGVGHFLFMEKPKEINDALTEFLTKQGLLK